MKKGLAVLAVAVLVFVFAGCESVEVKSDTKVSSASASSGSGNVMWNFESKGTDGWYGKGKWAYACTSNDMPKYVREGKYSLKIDAKGSKGWNQNIAMQDGPFHEEFGKLKKITMDVYVPAKTMKDVEYAQIFLVISGSSNSWYQVPQGLKTGWNKLVDALDEDNIAVDIWHIYLVFNSGGSLGGPVYVDNIVGVF